MTKLLPTATCLVIAALAWNWLDRPTRAEEPAMKAGFAEADITPELGMEVPGGYGKAYCRSIHDPCKVRAAVFDDGRARVALVCVDASGVRRQLVHPARKEIQRRCGIPAEAILIGASHSHSSGPVFGILPGEYDHASAFVQQLAYEKTPCANPVYLERVHKAIVEAVCTADSRRAEARCGVGTGIEDKVAFNRRFRMKNGLSYTHPGKGNPDILAPAGPTDPAVGVIGAWDKQGKLVGCVVTYACHATCNPGGISANWIYYMEQTIRGVLGPDAIVVFLQGASGDVTQVDSLDPHVNPSPERWSRLVGGRVGAEAVKVLLSMEPGRLAPLDYKIKLWDVKRRKPSVERVKAAMELVRKDPKQVDATEWTFAKETVMLDALLVKHPLAQVEVQAIQVGPAVFLANPAEFFCQLGLDVKKGSPFKYTFPVGLANDCVSYVPTEEAFGPHGGGYETRLTSWTNLEPTAGTQIVQASLELARQMKPGDEPKPQRAPQGKPWTYGNLPPERE
jgi:hypothetical protein